MKKWTILVAMIFGAAAAGAQSPSPSASRPQPTNAAPAKIAAGRTNAPPAGGSQPSLQAQGPGAAQPALSWFRPAKPNEFEVGKLTYSGIAVQAIKAKNPLQLINPAAPARYGSGQDNLVRFTFSGTGPMLKLFSIDF
jgi:hypothetical protein